MTQKFTEVLHDGFAQSFEVTQMLVHEQTQFQDLKIFDTPLNGRVMALDNIVQISTKDESSYSEMLTHLPAFDLLAQGARLARVMIVGGGDGAVAEEALKHKGLEEVVMAEIDPRVVELCREHFADLNAPAFSDARFNVQIADAFEYLKAPKSKGAFDLIIADRPDPVGPAQVLFDDSFYDAVSAALTPTGVAVFQNGAPFYQPSELTDTMPQLRKAFKNCGVFYTVTPTYAGGPMALTWASNGSVLGQAKDEVLDGLFKSAAVTTDYYTPRLHNAAFRLPAWLERLARGEDCALSGREV